jgi:hypothetical protein
MRGGEFVGQPMGTVLKVLPKTVSLVTEADSLPRIQHSRFFYLSTPTRNTASNNTVTFQGHNYKAASDNLNVNPVENILRVQRTC